MRRQDELCGPRALLGSKVGNHEVLIVKLGASVLA